METSKLKAVVFDCGGVIVCDMKWELIYEAADKQYHESIKEEIGKQWNVMKMQAQYSETTFWNAVAQAGKIPSEKIPGLTLELKENMDLHAETWQLIKSLRSLNPDLLLAVCSNHATDWFNYFTRKYEFEKVFPEPSLLVSSAAVKLAKPDVEIYKEVTKRLQKFGVTDPGQVLFVDDKQRNLDVAAKYGWKTCLYNAFAEKDAPASLRACLKEHCLQI